MGSFLKWVTRAERYEEILHKEGIEKAEQYLIQFSNKIDKLMEAIWELQIEKEEIVEEDKFERRLQRKALIKRKKILQALGMKESLVPEYDQ